MRETYDCLDPQRREEGIRAAADAVRNGRCVVLPTDTVYGIGCDAFNNDAVATLLATKHR
ncbi:Sua5/YciO/YrdC/YwlC family protein, partial [Mycobacterium tuberculosis]|nr:Sua5/YciO/YrdC/YwlC family protein [Mycobacterium tuberculosis]